MMRTALPLLAFFGLHTGCCAFVPPTGPRRAHALSRVYSTLEERPTEKTARPQPRADIKDINPRALELFGSPYEAPAKLGTDYLPPETLERAKKGSFVEKMKLKKDGVTQWTEVHELAALLRTGQFTWEELNLDDADQRLKWAGLFHRRKRTPGRFMMRMKIPNGIVSSDALRFMAESLVKYGDDEAVTIDITTRQNLQLRGLKLEDTSDIIVGLVERGLGCYMSGMDNVRNMVGSPLAGIDPLELYDTRQLCEDINNMITNNNRGNPEWGNLPRKFNIALSGSRDDYAHTHINDIGFQPIARDGVMGFNVVVGGYMSTKRVAFSEELDMWVPPSEAVNLCYAILRLFRDHGNRKDRQKARLLWLVEEWGVEKFRDEVIKEMEVNQVYGGHKPEVHRAVEQHGPAFERRDYLGVHKQKQEGLNWVGVHVPVGRFLPFDAFEVARVADKYSNGEIRLTVEQNIIFPNVKDEDVESLLSDPFFQGRFSINPGPLSRALVSCTGAQFCGVALVETKNRALRIVDELEAKYHIPQTVRMHWSGCPNQCGQSQVADIGLMGAPAKKDGKAVEGADVFLGGAVGEVAELGEKLYKNVAFGDNDEGIINVLSQVLVDKYGAVPK